MTRSLVVLISGRRMRYLVLVFWPAVAMVGAAFAGKLGGLITSDTGSYVPSSAESTKVLEVQPPFSSPDTRPAIVIYDRPSGPTVGDQAKIAADVTAFGQRKDLDGQVTGPIRAADGSAAQGVAPLDRGRVRAGMETYVRRTAGKPGTFAAGAVRVTAVITVYARPCG